MTKKSAQLQAMYGASTEAVFNRLEELDPKLNEFIQTFAYDQVWTLPPLSLREKSMITVASLVALGKPEQLQTHFLGFLNLGGSVEELRAMLIHLAVYCGFPASLASFAVLKELLDGESENKS